MHWHAVVTSIMSHPFPNPNLGISYLQKGKIATTTNEKKGKLALQYIYAM